MCSNLSYQLIIIIYTYYTHIVIHIYININTQHIYMYQYKPHINHKPKSTIDAHTREETKYNTKESY